MHRSNKFAHAHIIQLALDILSLIIVYLFTYLTCSHLSIIEPINNYVWTLVIYVPIWVSIMALLGMYDKTTFFYPDRIMRSVILASSFSGLGLGTMFFFVKDSSASHLLLKIFFLLCVIIMFLERFISSRIFQRGSINNSIPRIVVVCSQQTLNSFHRYLSKTHIRFNVIETIQFDIDAGESGQPDQKSLNYLEEILKSKVVDEVVLALPGDYNKIATYLHLCEQMGITVHLVLNPLGPQKSHVYISMLGPLPVLTFNTVTLNPFQKFAKRVLDIAGSLIGIFITIVFAVFIAPAIKLNSPGPVIFKQSRVGRNGRVFNLYKFRTMCKDAESQKEELQAKNEYQNSLMFKIKEDPRITPIGAFLRKTSLDELPQFFNVLKGDMSLVGTRPPTLDEFSHYELDHIRRISIKPGITGMWQISGRSNITDFNKVVSLDVWYIDNWSIWLDFYILFKTVWQVARMDAAF